jgi:hypothetical protein
MPSAARNLRNRVPRGRPPRGTREQRRDRWVGLKAVRLRYSVVALLILIALPQCRPDATAAVPPPNDLCSGAEPIPSTGPFPYLTAITADITAATITNDPPFPSCVDGNVSRSVWYTFTPATTATYTISTCLDTATTVADTVLAIYRSSGGCAGPFTQVACSDDDCGIRAALSTSLTAGITYYIVAWKWGTLNPSADAAAIQLRVSVPASAPNDLCGGAEIIPSTGPFPYSTSIADTTLATTSGDPPRPSCLNQFSRSVWYRFTPAETASYTISVCRPETATTIFDTLMAVYAAPGCGGPLTQVACSDDVCGFRSTITAMLDAGQTYFIVVWEAGNQALTVGETAVQLLVSAELVRITSVALLPDGTCRILFTATSGHTYAVQASVDMINWACIGTPTDLGGGQFQFDDVNAGALPQRFYLITSP